MQTNTIKAFSDILISWYNRSKRDLPWRKTSDPYKIWISEVILQQTRVDQGISYYERFIKSFPNIESLANADEQSVLTVWQGLGYYSRARNLHTAAKQIQEDLHGEFPRTYEEIIQLKGIGPYAAAAISSFAFNLPHAVIDGNVKRVISRYYGITGEQQERSTTELIKTSLQEVFDPSRNYDFNQAIMEFGARHCVPSNPNCGTCVFSDDCRAYQLDIVHQIPTKKKKIKKRHRYFQYAVVCFENKVILHKRTENDIWQNMYDFPSFESDSKKNLVEDNRLFQYLFGSAIKINSHTTSEWKKHILSHQDIHARFIEFYVSDLPILMDKDLYVVERENLNEFPLPKLIQSYFHES